MSLIKRIVVIEDGHIEQVFKDKKKKRKGTRMMRPLEKVVRRALKASNTLTEESLDRHNRSSRKKKNGWARDWMKNSQKANRKALKKLVRR